MLRSLQIFRDLVETRSFTETGHRNYVTQSAVSQHLKALEQRYGHHLLQRRGQQIELTRVGRLVYEAAQDILRRYERLESALKKPPREVSGTLRVAATLTVGLYELASHVTSFMKRYPKVDLQLTYFKAPELYEAVLTARADLGLMDYPQPHSHLKTELFKNDSLVLIVPPKHVWAARHRIRLSQVAGQPFIMMQRGQPSRRALDNIFERARVSVTIVHEFDNIELIKRAVEVEAGIAIVPRGTIVNEVQSGTLRSVELAEGPFQHPIKILTRRYAERSLPTQQFISLLSFSPPLLDAKRLNGS